MYRQTIIFLLALAGFLLVSVSGQAQQPDNDVLPMTTSTSAAEYFQRPLTYPQQLARYEAEQRAMRIERNRWIGFEPSRPNTNASYMYSGLYNFNPGISHSMAYGSSYRLYGW